MQFVPETSKELLTLINNTKCTILKFSAVWCGPCKNKDFLKSYNELKKKYENNSDVKFIELDVDKNEELINDQDLEFNIISIPTIKIYSKGKLLNQFTGIGNILEVEKNIHTILKFI
jgi:thiol-disulfide isomerase/thioredoxin